MNLLENIKLALRAIMANRLRTILTIVIILMGIAAIIGIPTATDGIKVKLVDMFTDMGSNTFSIRSEGTIHRHGGIRRNRKEVNPPFTIQQITAFKNSYHYPSVVSNSCMATGNGIIVHESKKTNPNVRVIGIDENYLQVSGYSIGEGRNFSNVEIENGSDAALLGKDVVSNIFEPYDTVVGSLVNIGSRKYKVVGVLTSKGASQLSSDNQVMIPLDNARYNFPSDETDYSVNVMVKDATELDVAIEEAIGVLRSIRSLRVGDENDFNISKSERLADQIFSDLKSLRIATLIIGILTLIGAGIGLMNIMLVSVNERTREIGVSKALGATKRTIIIQFLTESIVICQIGGLIGIVVGIFLGNLLALVLKSGFVFPVVWVIAGIVFTFIVGLAAGIYPAIKAAELDPVEALRYE